MHTLAAMFFFFQGGWSLKGHLFFIEIATHVKKATNKHRYDYWPPVLSSSPPPPHLLIFIQRGKNQGYILHTEDINKKLLIHQSPVRGT